MDVADEWTLSELVEEATSRITALPPPKNGQVRAVPDDRTIRYYGTIGLLDKPTVSQNAVVVPSTIVSVLNQPNQAQKPQRFTGT